MTGLIVSQEIQNDWRYFREYFTEFLDRYARTLMKATADEIDKEMMGGDDAPQGEECKK